MNITWMVALFIFHNLRLCCCTLRYSYGERSLFEINVDLRILLHFLYVLWGLPKFQRKS